MLFCRIAVKSKTTALQHRNTARQRMTSLSLRRGDFDIRISNLANHIKHLTDYYQEQNLPEIIL